MKLNIANNMILINIIFLISSSTFIGCKKEWLDEKPQKSMVVPKTISDYQAILDNASDYSTYGFNAGEPALNEVSAGDFYIPDWLNDALDPYEQNIYKWSSGDVYAGYNAISDWNGTYKVIFSANIIIDGIEKITPEGVEDQKAWNNVKGAAFFSRGFEHYSVAQLFCKPYNKSTSTTDLGIPLRLTPNFNTRSVRATVQITYDQIISDLKTAKQLLPIDIPNNILYKNRPTKLAADAMLARVYLSMGNYDSAFSYSNQTLQRSNNLLDFNNQSITPTEITVAPNSLTPFAKFNTEVIFQKIMLFYFSTYQDFSIVDTSLYNSYNVDDLRKTTFFYLNSAGGNGFKGNYSETYEYFGGLATDEMYLIRAECNARKGNKDAALSDLNTLMIKRWANNGSWIPFTANNSAEALQKILVERRKELCFRGLRWTDLRRLNMEPQYAITLTRTVNNQTYSLLPNDQKYVLPIPDEVIRLTGMEQNPR